MAQLELTTSIQAPGKGADELRAATLQQKLLAASIAAMTIVVVAGMMMAAL